MQNRRSFLMAVGGLALVPTFGRADSGHLTAQAAMDGMARGELILIDIRRPEEWQQTGVAKGAWPLDMTARDFGPKLLAVLERNPNRKIAIICRTGNRSNYLRGVLAKNGIKGVLDVAEGMAGGPRGKGWIPSGLPVVSGAEAVEALPQDLIAQ